MDAVQPVLTTEANKKIAVRWFDEIWNQGRRETIHELFGAEADLHDGGFTIHGPGEFERFYDRICSAFSEHRFAPVVMLAEGDLVSIHWSAICRHTESGKDVEFTGTSVARIENGQVVEAWQDWDKARVEAQISGTSAVSFI
jgi:predicted SnoaL-like aldol condensation-catalyzing enzyme